MMITVLVDRQAMSIEEEGSAGDDWKVLGFQRGLGGCSRRAIEWRVAGGSSTVSVSEAPQSPIVVSVSKQVQRVGKEYF